MDVMFFLVGLQVISLPFIRARLPKSFFTGTVVAPAFFTFASTEHATVTSRSVAVNSIRSFSARNSTLDQDRQRGAGADDVLDGLQPGEESVLW